MLTGPPDKHEIIAWARALEQMAEAKDLGPAGYRWACGQVASLIRRMRPDLNFEESTDD